MCRLYGEMVADNKMRVDIISYSGNKPGGVEVEEVLEGEGIHYVDPSTGVQWFEPEDSKEPGKAASASELQSKMGELSIMIESLKGDPNELGD